ncbi:MAG: Arc family DNA-binding protein [Pirellulaceae bacterium]
MAKRDSFLLRIDPRVLAEIRRWADDEMRSVNAQIEYLLRQSLRQSGRPPKPSSEEEKQP